MLGGLFGQFGYAQAHSHSHGPAVHADDLYVYKEDFADRTELIQLLYKFMGTYLDQLPDPFPLSLLPRGTSQLLEDVAHEIAAPGANKFSWLEPLFTLGPLANAVTAAFHITFATNLVLRFSPTLDASSLGFLVAFAEGTILGNVFLHLIPESLEMGDPWGIIAGFLFFCVLEKALKIVGTITGNTHSHSHSHSPSETKKSVSETGSKVVSETAPQAAHKEGIAETKVYAVLNVAADFVHNITDGVALAAAFQKSTAAGVAAFVLMALHELPHQFGDFALLVQGGASKSAALQAQLLASSGTIVGCALFGVVGSSEWIVDKITPFTAGVFLYIGAVGVLPELLEVEGPDPLKQALVQAVGVAVGLYTLYLSL